MSWSNKQIEGLIKIINFYKETAKLTDSEKKEFENKMLELWSMKTDEVV